jgi:sec-independent protein translocase protein TatA
MSTLSTALVPALAISMPGMTEWLIILVIVVIFFGVGKLPNVLGQMGKGVKAFKEGMDPKDEDGKNKEIDVTPSSAAATTRAEEAEEVRKGR